MTPTPLTETCGMVHLAGRSQVELRGADRAAFFNRMCTNKVDTLPPGRGCETFLTSVKGRALAYGFVFAEPERLVFDTAPGQAEKIIAHLDYYLIREKVTLHDRTAAWSDVLVAGPQSSDRLGQTAGAALPGEYLEHTEIELAGRRVAIRRVNVDGPAAFFVSCDAEALAEVCERLQAAGIVPCSPEAAEALRIERAWPEYGRDITDDNFPQEVARDAWAISYNKGCYVGQETIARIASRGHVNRTLVSLRFDGAQPIAAGEPLAADGQTVGRVTSAAFSPRFGATLALGYVRLGYDQPGTRLESSVGPVTVFNPSLPPGDGRGEGK